MTTGPTRLASRSSRVPVYTFQHEPGVPSMWVMRIDEQALDHVDRHDHVHDFPGLIYFEGTGGGLRRAEQRTAIEAGDCYLIRPAELVHLDDPDGLLAARGRGLYFTPEVLSGTGYGTPDPTDRLGWRVHPLLWPFTATDDEVVGFRVPPAERPAWDHALTGIERELRERRDGYRRAALAHLVLLLVATARLVPTAAPPRSGSQLLDQVLAEIERGFRGRLTLGDIAGALHLSTGHLTTTVRELTGRTVQDWIVERRLTEARRLLLETELSIQAIGRRVGYPDPGYFARVFRQVHGVPPREWRAAAG